ncbi:HesA/MoeB/ThiF family protein [Acidimangrovimonas sediminis]|uniref:HesA/MoeB/ThiF family protein n=1 Tax=Acidimangrovimonas sediminis TaxID=2056283 RepID=UPI000C804C12|nr:HesA/MoeB/ThiF family protein [Acidimangrovimonas sediminis]
MRLVLIIAAALWCLGWLIGAPVRWRNALGVLVIGAAMALQLVLPAGNPLRAATGGDIRGWLVIVAIAALVLAYRAGLARLRARAWACGGDRKGKATTMQDLPRDPGGRTDDEGSGPEEAPAHQVPTQQTPAPEAKQPLFTPDELGRYARHIMLREIGGPGQRKLKQARVLVIGAGGLGAPALLYLAAAGVGTLGIVDDDVVDASNLQRQVIHDTASVGQPKVASAAARIHALNPYVAVDEHRIRLTAGNARDLIAGHDLVLDGSDNFDTRYLVNRVAAEAGVPLISAAITQWEGQISLYDPARGTPCYECVFPERPAPGQVPTCAEAGVVAPLPGILGTMMALEAVKHITGAGATLRGEMLVWDGLWGESRKFRLTRRAACPACGHLHPGTPDVAEG